MCSFFSEHHVLSLATSYKDSISACSLFYLFIPEEACFLFASDEKTEHMQYISGNPNVACTVHNETKEVMHIKGIQVKGVVKAANEGDEQLYTDAYPYAKEIKSKRIWKLKITELKYTDNSLEFGQKEIWKYA